jgi:anoctamin-10
MIMNKIFRRVAMYATDRENHRLQSSYNNSLIIKRFVFEFCDCFLYLLYIGIYSLNINMLKTNLVSLFIVDEIRRVVTETLIPYIA